MAEPLSKECREKIRGLLTFELNPAALHLLDDIIREVCQADPIGRVHEFRQELESAVKFRKHLYEQSRHKFGVIDDLANRTIRHGN